jgi:hypothetical protein
MSYKVLIVIDGTFMEPTSSPPMVGRIAKHTRRLLAAVVGLPALLALPVSCHDVTQNPASTASTAEALTSPACASATAGDVFSGGMAGCGGSVTWANRASLCAAGYRPATAAEWQFSGGVPTHDYWTNDNLEYGGTAGSCFVSYSQGSACPAGQPMRVCTSSGTDAEGNLCNWTNCGMESSAYNAYFGGCSGNTTAGTLCVPAGGCANGAVAQVFGNGIVGCAGSVSFANAATLCAPGYAPITDSVWQTYRGSTTPTHNYWLNDDYGFAGGLAYWSGSGSGACKAYGASDFCSSCNACPAGTPMHVCTPGGTDPEGNSCTWTNCTGANGSTDQYYGGCSGVETAGTLCAPLEGCAGGLVAQHFTVGSGGTLAAFDACAGSVSWPNASTLCMPGYQVASASQWQAFEGNVAPTNNYWTSDNLLWSGTSSACSVSTTTGNACPTGQPMHVCTPSGTDPEGNGCTWANCGLNATTPDSYFGGCSAANNATAGALCVAPQPAVGVTPITGFVGATFGSQVVDVPNISVWARNTSTGALIGPVTTNPQGYFRTPPLPPGPPTGATTYQICVSGPGFVPSCDSQANTVAAGPPVVLNHTVSITPTPKAVWGTVRLQDSTPCFWFQPSFGASVTASVTLVDAGNNVIAGPVSGNSRGQYVLPVSVTGSYTVKATCELASGSAAVSLSSTSLQQDIVVSNSGPQIKSLDFTSGGVGLRRADPGTVVTATVTATDPNSDTLHYKWTDDSGRVLALPDAPTVSWTVLSTTGPNVLHVQVSDTQGGYAMTQRGLVVGPNSLLFEGTVYDRASGFPVANAQVTLDGTTVTTGANGVFQVSVPDAPRFVLNAKKTGYALTSRIYYGRATGLRIPLDAASTTTVNASSGGTVTFLSVTGAPIGLSATFPANALVDQNNNPYTGTATIEGFVYDIKLPSPIPGDQGGVYNGVTSRLITYGSFHMTPRDTMGNPLQMAAGKSVNVTMAIDPIAQSTAPATIPLFLYDEPSGMWLQHSTATRTGNSYQGNVTHFSAFNADTITTSGSSCVKVILDPFSFHGPLELEGEYADPQSGFFHHNDTIVTDNTIGIERLTPNVNFTLYVKDPSSGTVLKQVVLNSGPPLSTQAFPTGIVTDPNFGPCNGPYTIYNSAVPTGPAYLVPASGGSIQDNSASYYAATNVIGGDGTKATFALWKTANGFTGSNDDASAIYYNNGDLMFGRSMHCRKTNPNGAIACYVSNFGKVGDGDSATALSLAKANGTPAATVCMEYNPAPPGPAGSNQYIQFYAYQGNGAPFTGNAFVNGPTLDTQGPKPMPEMCMACHGGSYSPSSPTNDSTTLVSSASFLPFDLDSFVYDQTDPTLDPHTAPAVQESFRKLNSMVLATTNTSVAPAYTNLMNLWYGVGGVNVQNTPFHFGTSGVNLPPAGSWSAGNKDLYDIVVSKVCRTCHLARSSGDNWTSFAQMSPFQGFIKNYACGSGALATDTGQTFFMPHAEVPFKAFWTNNLGATLATQLGFGTCPNP